jgi:hypothetical protein
MVDASKLKQQHGAKLDSGDASRCAFQCALVLTRLMTSMLYGVAANDPLTFTGVIVLIGLVAAAACALPARRCASIQLLPYDANKSKCPFEIL